MVKSDQHRDYRDKEAQCGALLQDVCASQFS